jgi:formylglycine-generating enzyme required for sulfatase activity
MVHRDIKPGNLWLERMPEGATRVKILDFGLARAQNDDVQITEYGTIVGTPAFMAPEQARADREVDARADLFSLGCVLYVLCSGEIPFKAETTVGTLMALAMNQPVAPDQRNDSVPPELSALVMQLLEKDPSDRPQSARKVIDRIRQIEQSVKATSTEQATLGETLLGVSKPITASPSTPVRALHPVRQRVRRTLQVATGVVIAALALAAAGVFLWPTADGRIVRIESNDPSIQLAFEGDELKVIGAYDQPITVTPGKVDLRISKTQPNGEQFEFQTDKLVVNKGDQIALKIELLGDEIRVVREGTGVVDSMSLSASTDLYEELLAAMRQANPGFDGSMVPRFEGGRLVALDFKTDNVTDISPLRELKYLRGLRMEGNYSLNSRISDLSPLKNLPLTRLYIYNSLRVTDLSPLKGMQLQDLDTTGCPIADFSPLAGMPLQILQAWSWVGSDLSPLKGMPLTELNIGGNGKPMDLSPLAGAPLEFLCCNASEVSDITPLQGMPLKTLMCENTQVSDLSPIAGAPLGQFVAGGSRITDFTILRDMPLTWVKFDIVPERDLEILRDIKTLVRINDQRAGDFLREFDAGPRTRAVSPAFTNSLGMEFVQIPKGKAWLVRTVGETGTTSDHETSIDQDFLLGMYEVTQEEWVKVMGSNPSWFTRGADGADAVKILPDDVLKRLPVERVSWIDCQAFLTKLNELDSSPGWVYRLPTEAEWQYACRGGSMNDPSEGKFEFYTTSPTNTLTPDDANIQHSLGWNRPCRVGLFSPNKLGLYDMHGNIWEWCQDAPMTPQPASRYIHGGGWNDTQERCQASSVLQPTEPWLYYDLGFRVARVPATSVPGD